MCTYTCLIMLLVYIPSECTSEVQNSALPLLLFYPSTEIRLADLTFLAPSSLFLSPKLVIFTTLWTVEIPCCSFHTCLSALVVVRDEFSRCWLFSKLLIAMQAVRRRAQVSSLALTFHPGRDHADEELQDFKVFVNPSLSDVVATTTAEALAMGKFVVCADHPCNRFFSTFSNCIIYRSPEEFSEKLEWALSHEPQPLSHSELARLSWEDATERFLDAVQLSPLERPNWLVRAIDNVVAAGHNTLTGVEPLRIAAGAGASTLESPLRVTDYKPCHFEEGGFFDNHKRAADVRNRV